MQAIENLREALKGKTRSVRSVRKERGFRVVARQMAEVYPEDVVAACDLIPEQDRDQRVKDLRAGSANASRPDTPVGLFADDVFHLVDKAAAAAASRQPASPAAEAHDPEASEA